MRNVQISKYVVFLISNGHKLVDKPDNADIILIWTCGFRKDVRDNSISEIERCVKEYKAEVIVAGCFPDIDGDYLRTKFNGKIFPWREDESMMETFFGSKVKLADIPPVLYKKQLYKDEAKFRKENPDADMPFIGRYAQIYIAEGCPWECTYCSECLAFPPFKSYPEERIIEAVHKATAISNTKNIILLADSVGDYGTDTDSSLPNLIHRIIKEIPDIKIAIQDLNPYHFLKFYQDMFEFIADGIITHLQIPIQSASDRILKKMGRKYTNADLKTIFSMLDTSNFKMIDVHLIVGFPGERDEDFEGSVFFVLNHKSIRYVLLSQFMEAPNIPATNYPNRISDEVKRARIKYAMGQFKKANIICNSDYSSLSKERLRRQNMGKKDQRKYDGRASFSEDDEIEKLLDEHFERYNVEKREICRNFMIYTRRLFLKRFIAHYELFRKTIELPGDIVELGVYRGASLMTWANLLEVTNMGDRAKQVIGFDNWEGFKKFHEKDGKPCERTNKVIGGYNAGIFREILVDAIKIYDKDRFIPYKPRIILIDGDIEETVPKFIEENPGLRICLLHVDCDIYEPTKTGLEYLWPRIVKGGVVIFDDYGVRPWEGESTAVDEYFADKDVEIKRFNWAQSPGAYVVKE